jgi:hypothetical protein
MLQYKILQINRRNHDFIRKIEQEKSGGISARLMKTIPKIIRPLKTIVGGLSAIL